MVLINSLQNVALHDQKSMYRRSFSHELKSENRCRIHDLFYDEKCTFQPSYGSVQNERKKISDSNLSTMVAEMIENAPNLSRIQMHDSDCCRIVDIALQTITSMANTRGGLAGTISVGSYETCWGPKRCHWLCDVWKNRHKLDCGAHAALLQKMFELSNEYIDGQVSIHRVAVIMQSSKYESDSWNTLFSTEDRTSYGTWIHSSGKCVYHECLGIYSSKTGFNVYDPVNMAWFLPDTDPNSQGIIYAWFIESKEYDEGVLFKFGDKNVPKNKWFTLMPNVKSPNIESVIHLTESVLSVRLPTENRLNQLIVYISGVTNNNDNPSPGLGVARSLRHDFPKDSALQLKLIAADFSLESVGLGDPVFDDCLIFPSWDHCDAENHLKHVFDLIMNEAETHHSRFYISCLDVEVELLARELPEYLKKNPQAKEYVDQILIPPIDALVNTRKPYIHAASKLGFKLSKILVLDETNVNHSEVQAWCFSTGFPLLVKGCHYDALVANSWTHVQANIKRLQQIWGQTTVYLQQAAVGSEGSIVFSAYKGQLLTAVLMHKRVVTSEKKVWSSQVMQLPDELLKSLECIVKEIEWTGGSEIEFIETIDGTRYLIDWNPRFPAWIYGSVHAADVNVPLILIGAILLKSYGINILKNDWRAKIEENVIISPLSTGSFVRTTIEQRNTGVQSLSTASANDSAIISARVVSSGKGGSTDRLHPSRNTNAGKLIQQHKPDESKLTTKTNEKSISSSELPSHRDLESILQSNHYNTPLIICNHHSVRSNIKTMSDTILKIIDKMYHSTNLSFSAKFAVSIKTNPSREILQTCLKENMMAEAISLYEVRAALDAGFAENKIILNGPGKWFDSNCNKYSSSISLYAIIADSVEEFEQLSESVRLGRVLNNSQSNKLGITRAEYIGVRLAVPMTGSRFGVDIANPEMLNRVVQALKNLPESQKTIYHFHFASSTLGISAWLGAAKTVLCTAKNIDLLAGRSCSILDFGGGWGYNTLNETESIETLKHLLSTIIKNFPNLLDIIFEPGKAILQSTGILLSRVLNVRESTVQMRESQSDKHPSKDDTNNKSKERIAIIDTCIAELPDLNSHPHEFFWIPTNSPPTAQWRKLVRSNANGAIYGRICMENDILAHSIDLPQELKAGDLIAITSVGAYDSSMAYKFGTGIADTLHSYHLHL